MFVENRVGEDFFFMIKLPYFSKRLKKTNQFNICVGFRLGIHVFDKNLSKRFFCFPISVKIGSADP